MMWPRSARLFSHPTHFCMICWPSCGDSGRSPPRYRNTNSVMGLLLVITDISKQFGTYSGTKTFEPAPGGQLPCTARDLQPGLGREACASGGRSERHSFPGRRPVSQLLFLSFDLRGQVLTEILRFEHRADLDVGIGQHRIRAALHPLDGFVDRVNLPEPETCHELLGFREGPVDDRALLAREVHPLSLSAGFQAFAGEENPGLDEGFVELTHRREQLGTRHDSRCAVICGLDQYCDFHRDLLA